MQKRSLRDVFNFFRPRQKLKYVWLTALELSAMLIWKEVSNWERMCLFQKQVFVQLRISWKMSEAMLLPNDQSLLSLLAKCMDIYAPSYYSTGKTKIPTSRSSRNCQSPRTIETMFSTWRLASIVYVQKAMKSTVREWLRQSSSSVFQWLYPITLCHHFSRFWTGNRLLFSSKRRIFQIWKTYFYRSQTKGIEWCSKGLSRYNNTFYGMLSLWSMTYFIWYSIRYGTTEFSK